MAKDGTLPFEMLVLHGWTDLEAELLLDIMAQRSELAGREKVIEACKKELNQRALEMMTSHGTPSVKSAIGSLTVGTVTRSSLDEEKLLLALLKYIDVDVARSLVEGAKKTTTSTVVTFRSAKGG